MIPASYPQAHPRAMIFDWDNTLVDNWRTILNSLNFAKESFGLEPISAEEFWAIPHHSVKNVAHELFGKHWKEAEKIYYDKVREDHLENLQQLEGAAELLDTLSQLDIHLAVVSNKHGELLRKEASHLGWDKHFVSLIGSRDTDEDKPSPIPVREALKPIGMDAGHHVWFIGDSIVDVECARNSGCVPVAVGNNGASKEDNIINAGNCKGIKSLLERL